LFHDVVSTVEVMDPGNRIDRAIMNEDSLGRGEGVAWVETIVICFKLTY